MDLTGRTLLGKYEIEGLLGQGGMGAVWRARHALTGRKLAIKTLDASHVDNPAVVQRFGREARAASACQHPGIVEVLDLDQTEDGVPFLVMEFLEGENLARKIERRGRLTQDEVVDLGTKLLEGLEAAHSHGIIHRDLKPENIYVVPAGRRGETVKILDFGISYKSDEAAAKLTMTGSVLGTPHYMSPEQAMGETELDHRADVYAAGVVLYECAVGDVPFDAANYNKLLRTILDQPPVPPRRRGAQISAEIEQVILWAMEKDRERRAGSARVMIEWLGKAAAGEAPPYSAPPPPRVVRTASSSGGFPAQPVGVSYTPAGVLPPRPVGLAPTLGDGELTTSSSSWTLPDAPLEEEHDPSGLELDESALRGPSLSPSSPGTLAAASMSLPPPSSPGTLPAASLRTGSHSVPPAPASWRRYAVVGAAALAVFVLVVAAVRFVVQPGVDVPAAAEETHRAEVAAPRAPTWVSVAIEGLPPNAEVRVDGLPASIPVRLQRGGQHLLEISAPGYVDRRIHVAADRNKTVEANMRPALGTVEEEP